MFIAFDSTAEFQAWRAAVWAAWRAERSQQLAQQSPGRGHTPGGLLDWRQPRPERDRSSKRYGPHHARAGEPMDPKPGRTGGLVRVTTVPPGCRDDSLIHHLDSGGGVLFVHESIRSVVAGLDVAQPVTRDALPQVSKDVLDAVGMP